MKKAIAYIRISDKDQSNFSTEAQQKHIKEYASKHNIEVISFFEDDGRSAKNFDRPNWINLENFIKKHFRNIDYLIVVKYDRFSRNASEGLQKIELLERKFRIIIISVFEQMFIDYDSPFFFKQRADMLVNAEFELHVIRDRTRFGMHHALSEGRYVSNAPYGYLNRRDDKKKPIIIIDEVKANIIKKIFDDYMNDVPIVEIYKQAKQMGLTLRGHSTISDILKNPVYGGLVNVPAYRKEAAKIVKGIHQGIVSEATWWQVQEKLGVIINRTTLNDAVPLRGILKCPHGFPLTAGESKGRSKKYWYYKSNHCSINISATKMHWQFDEVLKLLSLTDESITFLRKKANIEFEKSIKERADIVRNSKVDLIKVETNINRLEEKFITEQVNHETYSKWHKIYASQLESLRYQINNLETNTSFYINLFNEQLPKLTDIHFLYHKMELLDKRCFIKEVFNSELYWQDNAYRTTFIIDLLRHNELILKEKGLLFIEQSFEKNAVFAGSAPERS